MFVFVCFVLSFFGMVFHLLACFGVFSKTRLKYFYLQVATINEQLCYKNQVWSVQAVRYVESTT